MDNTTDNLACEQCGQHIGRDELMQGLAVKVNGQLVCANCVDALPGEAQVRINQVRALRGLEVVTYQVLQPAHPGLHLYTFTTAANLNQLRRGMASGAISELPVLDLSIKASLPPALMRPALVATAALARRRKRLPLIPIGAGVGAIALIGVLLLVFNHDGKPAGSVDGAAHDRPGARTPAPVANKVRADFPVDPRQAWNAASQDQACPPDVLRTIADEMGRERARQLDAAEQALVAGNAADAAKQLDAQQLPDHIFFRGLRSREDELRKHPPTTAPAPAIIASGPSAPVPALVADAAPVIKPVPAPAPALAANPPLAPPPVAPPPTAPLPAPPVVTVSSLDALRIPCGELLSAGGNPGWIRQDEKDLRQLRLDTDKGDIARSLQLAGGQYQVWINASGPGDGGELALHIGDQVLHATIKGRNKDWHQLQPGTIVLPAGPAQIRIEATGKDLLFAVIYLAGTAQLEPRNAKYRTVSKPPQWTDQPPVPAQGLPASTRTLVWTPRFLGAVSELNPFDEKARVPSGLPIGAERVFESQMGKGRKRQALVLDLTGSSIDKGGLALLLHPLRSDRRQVTATLADQKDHAITFPAIDFPQSEWTTQVLALDAIPAGDRAAFSPSQLKSLTLEDHDLLTTGFLLGKAAVINAAPPTVAALELRPATLMPLAYRDLDRLLDGVAGRRKWRAWRKDFNPGQVKVLLSLPLLSHQYAEDLRQILAPLLRGEDLLKDRLPDDALDDLKPGADYGKRLFADQAPLIPDRFQVAVFFIAGCEPLPEFASPATFTSFWLQQVVDPCLSHGVLPVVVLGPKELRPGGLDLEKQWVDLDQALRKTRPGVPAIDLRAVTGIGGPEMESAAMADAARALGDGYGELVKRLRSLQKTPPRP